MYTFDNMMAQSIKPLSPVEPISLAAQVADKLVEAIGAGRFASEARLIETELATELGVSRVPVREALRLLESHGLVVSRPHRGTRLIRFDLEWAKQIYEVRAALELVATRRAAQTYRTDLQRRHRLQTQIREIQRFVGKGDRRGVNRNDLAFHDMIYEDAASPLLQTMWEAIRRHVRIAFAKETDDGVDLALIAEQHTRLLEVMLNGDEAALADEVEDHIRGPLSLLGQIASRAA